MKYVEFPIYFSKYILFMLKKKEEITNHQKTM